MQANLSLTNIYISNTFGALLSIVLLYCNRRSQMGRKGEYGRIQTIIHCTLLCCVVDLLNFTFDGKPGMLAHWIVLIGNTILFICNALVGVYWISFLGRHLNGSLKRWHGMALNVVLDSCLVLLAINLFKPVVFSVSDNVYTRGPLYWYFVAIDVLCVVDSLVLYCVSKKRGGVLKFFPVWTFILPALTGLAMQTALYGVSVIWPCVAISAAGVITSLLSESIYTDPLTGVFSRAYLDRCRDMLSNSGKEHYSCIMLDLNRFKSINDKFGHGEGDAAVKKAAKLMKSAVGTLGNVIRYAGDEFVIILNTSEEKEIEDCCKRIEEAFEKFNTAGTKPYKLSVSMGYGVLRPGNESMDEFMNRIDKKMYENKRAYYQQHAEFNRRR